MSKTASKNWETTTLEHLQKADVIECMNGYSSGVHNQDGDGIPHIRPFNISPLGHSSIEQLKYIPAERHKESSSLQVRDVIFNNTNTEELVGKTAVWRHPGLFGFSNHMTRIRVKKFKEVNPEFLAFYLHYHWQTGMSRQLCRRHVSQASIMGDRFFKIAVPKPSELEQTRIAFILTKIQQAIELETKLIRVTRELKAAVMKKLFTEGLNGEPPGETEIGLVPESWGVSNLGDVAKIFNGYAFKSSEIVPASKTQLLRMGNLYMNQLDLTRNPSFFPDSYVAQYKDFVLRPYDIVMSLTGTMGKEDYGFAVEIPKNLEGNLLLNQRVAKLIVKEPREFSPRFFLHFLRTRMFLDKLYPTAKGTKQANLSSNIMLAIKVPTPCFEEQIKIAAILDTIDAELTNREEKTKRLNELFSTTLACLMSGAIRISYVDLDTKLQGVAA